MITRRRELARGNAARGRLTRLQARHSTYKSNIIWCRDQKGWGARWPWRGILFPQCNGDTAVRNPRPTPDAGPGAAAGEYHRKPKTGAFPQA
jgi:hypothetical protein